MKRSSILIALSLCLASCGAGGELLEVNAPTDRDMINEVVEFTVADPKESVVYDCQDNVVPSQITYDGKLLIQATVDAGMSKKFYLRKGVREEYDAIACGAFRPEKLDDIAWENDKIGFRVYAKEYIKLGSKLYGYDIFSKRGAEPVLDELYWLETRPETTRLKALYKGKDPVAYDKLIREISYHLDHGKGMDYYPVGPTLGCGTAALVVNDKTIYPTYYSKFEILDNGPLRFTLRLEFDPIVIAGEQVVEERLITLDAGTHFNKIEVNYNGLTKPTKVIVGLVMHDEAEKYEITDNSIAYVEPFHSSGWQIYNSVIFDDSMKGVVDLFDEAGREAHGGAFGHLQAESTYTPNSTLTYYMGAGWNGWEVATSDDWFEIVKRERARLIK